MTPAATLNDHQLDDQPNPKTSVVPALKSPLIKLGELITTEPMTFLDLVHQLTDAAYLTLSMISYVKNCQDNVSASAANTDYNHFIKNSGHKPKELLIMLSSLLLMIALAILASKIAAFFAALLSVKNKEKIFKKIKTAWTYIRDILSGLKNGRTAFVNTNAQITPLFHHHILHYHLANPIGIGIGLVLAPALITYRYLNSQRDDYIIHNEEIIKNLIHGVGFALNRFSKEDIRILQTLTFNHDTLSKKIKEIDLEKNDYRKMPFTLDEQKELEKALNESETVTEQEHKSHAFTEQKKAELISKFMKYNQAKIHGNAKQKAMIMLSFFDAITDAPYMFSAITLIILNLAGLSAVTMGAPIIVLATILVIYTLSSLFTKAYSEIQKQKKLQKSADEVIFEKLQRIATTTKEELDTFQLKFKKKYGVKAGEVGSRIQLEDQGEQLKTKINTICGVTDKKSADLLLEKQLQLINTDMLQPRIQKNLDYHLNKNSTLQDKSFNPNLGAIIQNNPLHNTSIQVSEVDEQIDKIKIIMSQHEQYRNHISQNSIGTNALPQKSEQMLELERSLDYLQQYRSLIEACNNLTTTQDHRTLLTLKAYYAAIIKAENTLSETCGYTTDNMPLDSKKKTETTKEKTETTNDLNLKLKDIKTTLKTLSAYNPFTYQRAQRLQQEYRLVENIKQLVEIKNSLEQTLTDGHLKITRQQQFTTYYSNQKKHLNDFRVIPPIATKLSTLWRCLRSFIMAPKNIINTIDGAIGDVVSGIAGPIIKYGILLPLSTLCGWFLAKLQKEECQKEGPAKSPTLFACTPDSRKKSENPSAAATMHLL